jgi:hypothetical protein
MYSKVYVINAPIRSISGTHSITEEDLGLEPGTLPPEELATLGHLIVVDKKQLAPGEKLRAKTKRLLSSVGVKVGMGTVVTSADVQPLTDKLETFKTEFYDWKDDFLSSFHAELNKRVAEHPKYAELIKRYAPDVKRIERRLSFDIDVFKIDVPDADPYQPALAKTLSRSGNDITKRLVKEVADFVANAHKGSIQKSQKLVKQNMGPLRDTLLPKIKSFQLLDSSLAPVSAHLESFITDVSCAIDAQPTGHAFLDGDELKPFEARMNQLRSVSAIENLIANAPKATGFSTAKKDREDSIETPKRVPPVVGQLPKRPDSRSLPSGTPRRTVNF